MMYHIVLNFLSIVHVMLKVSTRGASIENSMWLLQDDDKTNNSAFTCCSRGPTSFEVRDNLDDTKGRVVKSLSHSSEMLVSLPQSMIVLQCYRSSRRNS